MNTAFLDGHNLGWKLAWVPRGWAGEALLDSYEAERRPVGVRNTLRSMGDTGRTNADGLTDDLGVRYCSEVIPDGGGPDSASSVSRPAPATGPLICRSASRDARCRPRTSSANI